MDIKAKLVKAFDSGKLKATFQEKLVKLRKLKGITQDEFACAVGVSRQAVYKWESGQSYPEVAKLLEMKILFNISIDDLLDENYEVVVPEKKKKRASKEVKMEIEELAANEVSEEPVLATEAEEVAALAVEPAAEAVPMTEEAPTPIAEEASDVAEREEKKVGFFGRLFGRK